MFNDHSVSLYKYTKKHQYFYLKSFSSINRPISHHTDAIDVTNLVVSLRLKQFDYYHHYYYVTLSGLSYHNKISTACSDGYISKCLKMN